MHVARDKDSEAQSKPDGAGVPFCLSTNCTCGECKLGIWWKTALVDGAGGVGVGVAAVTMDVEAESACVACLAFHFVQSCFLCPLVWQVKHLCSTAYAFRSSSERKSPRTPAFAFSSGVFLGLPLAFPFFPLFAWALSAWPFPPP